MNTPSHSSWIKRKIADQIFEQILIRKPEVVVYLIRASAGMGKTFLARDLGTRLNSQNGLLPSRREDILFSGLLDLYDPENLSNKRIERHLIQAFTEKATLEFAEYERERNTYEDYQDSGYYGAYLEEQRQRVERSFSAGLRQVADKHYPVIVFDTVERLQAALDPTERYLGKVQDTASVWFWLLFQISQLPRGVVLLFGRPTSSLEKNLESAIREANLDKRSKGLIDLEVIDLPPLDPGESHELFKLRENHFADLSSLLTTELKEMLVERTAGNPLFLDMALQHLLETSRGEELFKLLASTSGVQKVGEALVNAYMSNGSTLRQTLLAYLAVAGNGMSHDLLQFLEPKDHDKLWIELGRMEQLPFIKVRALQTIQDESDVLKTHTTYFLHDAMYEICEGVDLVTPKVASAYSQKILAWYTSQIAQSMSQVAKGIKTGSGRRSEQLLDLYVNSLQYRMRADPVTGYRWYLEESDKAIRNVETSYDMRLRDGIASFLASFDPDQLEGLPFSRVDRAIIESKMPNLLRDFSLDSAMLWIKRFSLRGKHGESEALAGRVGDWVYGFYQKDKEHYLVPYSELRLWRGTAIMYGRNPQQAREIFQEIVTDLEEQYDLKRLKNGEISKSIGKKDLQRICLVLGRAHNNLGYIFWMYQGKYWLAINEFQTAIEFFTIGELNEEQANSHDNIGRVYALLGHNFPALQIIKEGLELRKKIGQLYRIALSENSLALAHLRFGDLNLTIETAERALRKFRQTGIERGIGLSRLTLGSAHRVMAESWRDLDFSIDEAIRLLADKSRIDLDEAIRIFRFSVQEPIRLVQANNELACVFRARYLLLRESEAPEAEKEFAYRSGIQLFETAIATAKEYNYFIEELDNLQDQAVLMFRSARFQESNEVLDQIRQAIPEEYHILPGKALPEISIDDRIDAYYKLLGLVELLAGAIVYDQNITEDTTEELQEKRDVLIQVMDYYLLATAYFNLFSGETFAHMQTYERIYKRFRNCPRQLLNEIATEYVPKWCERNVVDYDLVKGLIEEVFGILTFQRKPLD